MQRWVSEVVSASYPQGYCCLPGNKVERAERGQRGGTNWIIFQLPECNHLWFPEAIEIFSPWLP